MLRQSVHFSFLASALFMLLGAVLAASCDSGSGGKVDQWAALHDRLSDALCACDSGCEPDDDPAYEACQLSAVRKHEAEIAQWLDCAITAGAEIETCVDAAGCNEQELSACQAMDIDEQCGDIPEDVEQAIDDEIDATCVHDIECFSGETVRGRYCNDREECDDGSDEEGCGEDFGPPSDGTGEPSGGAGSDFGVPGITEPPYTCTDGTTIPLDYVCDTEDDCSDGADEARCFLCATTFGSSELIRFSYVCDGVVDCFDAADENVAGCTPPASTSSLFECGNGETVLPDWVCDGHAHCTKGDDEENCYVCADDPARVMRPKQQCDGIQDCVDGSDELDCGALPDPRMLCESTVASNAGEHSVDACNACLCEDAREVATVCDAACWSLLACAQQNCPGAEADQSALLSCVISACPDSFTAVTSLTSFTTPARAACSAECPLLAP